MGQGALRGKDALCLDRVCMLFGNLVCGFVRSHHRGSCVKCMQNLSVLLLQLHVSLQGSQPRQVRGPCRMSDTVGHRTDTSLPS